MFLGKLEFLLLFFITCCYCVIQGLSICGHKGGSPYTITGSTDYETWPWMVSIGESKDGNWSHRCGATLIDPSYILTAAHCLISRSRVSLRLGDFDLSASADDGSVVLESDEFYLHPQYSHHEAYFDLGLVKIKETKFNYKIRPVCLPDSYYPESTFDNDFAIISGWGLSSPNDSNSSSKLHTAGVRVYSNSFCNQSHELVEIGLHSSRQEYLPDLFPPYMFCSGGDGLVVGSCKGDSGGPLQIFNVSTGLYQQIGVVSGTLSTSDYCGLSNHPTVYSRLDHPNNLDFIKRVINGNYDTDTGNEKEKANTNLREDPVQTIDDTKDAFGTWKPMKGDCGLRIGNEFIFNGETANPGEFPYIALIGYNHNTLGVIYTCGGTLINRWYVVTAAHCHDSSTPIAHVVLGEHVIDFETTQDCSDGKCLPPIQNISVSHVTVHEGWIPDKPDQGNDIALIRLAKPVKFYYDDTPSQSSVVPICIPWNPTDPGFELVVGSRTTIMGWGQVTNDRGDTLKNFKDFNAPTRTLQKAVVPITSTEACLKNLTSNFNETRQICAGGEGSVDSCNGDSGGPLAFQTNAQEPWYLVGIVSVGSRVCGEGRPAIYTKIVSYLKWITENLKQ